MKNIEHEPSSFRDPSGFIFYLDGQVYRQINKVHQEHYDYCIDSGLYKVLTETGLLISHREVDMPGIQNKAVYKFIQPDLIPFISYPYEWCFSQLKQAALATLKIIKISLEYGMILSDASAYNIQFYKGKPVFIDTLSLKKYIKGEPWTAYKQFCQHFLAPLALMSYTDIGLNQLLKVYIDGIPLDLASALLPFKTKVKLGLLLHIHFHAKSQKHYSTKVVKVKEHKLPLKSLLGLIDNIESTVNSLKWSPQGTEWADYYSFTNYSSNMMTEKMHYVEKFINQINPKSVWDLGANIGIFSRIASDQGIQTVSFDIDPAAVEKNYLESIEKGETQIIPLLLDLTNPSPAIGWENNERASLMDRGPVDLVLALALIHHLAISNNVPLDKVANFFSRICNFLIIEFVSKEDTQVKKLLATREDIFLKYIQHEFEIEFKNYFEILDIISIDDSQRTLYLMQRKG